MGLGFLGHHGPGIKRLRAGLGAKKGGWPGTSDGHWDRLSSGRREVLSCGARTLHGLQPGTWVSSGQAPKGGEGSTNQGPC